VAEFFPEIVHPKWTSKGKLHSGSAVEALDRQEPFVNQGLANPFLAMLARLFRYGRCPIMEGSRVSPRSA